MKLRLVLQARKGSIIPVNYQYPLSAAIYKILNSADEEYALFLHDTGYQKAGSRKSFKLFTFSDIMGPFTLQGDRLHLLASESELLVSFHLPQAAENFIRGLFLDRQVEIADRKSRTTFTIARVEALPVQLTRDSMQEVLLSPLSPIVCGKKNEKGNYDFLSPEHPDFIEMMLSNWREKYAALHGEELADLDFAGAGIDVVPDKDPPRSRLITIKADTPAETRVRGFVRFRLSVRGRRDILELLMNAGAGLYNSVGFGCVDI